MVARLLSGPAVAFVLLWTSAAAARDVPSARFEDGVNWYDVYEDNSETIAAALAELKDNIQHFAGKKIAYFSLEIASIMRGQRYGGLGPIARDLIRSTGDYLKTVGGEAIGVGLLYTKAYTQTIVDGKQVLDEEVLDIEELLRRGIIRHPTDAAGHRTPLQFEALIFGQKRQVRVFEQPEGEGGRKLLLHAEGITDHRIYDADVRTIKLLGGEEEVDILRLQQELLLGKAGAEALKRLETRPDLVHLNESHTGFVPAFMEFDEDGFFYDEDGQLPVLTSTTHTQKKAGFDDYPLELLSKTGLPDEAKRLLERNGRLDLGSGIFYGHVQGTNTVGKEQTTVMRDPSLYPDVPMVAVTNGSDEQVSMPAEVWALRAKEHWNTEAFRRELWQAKAQLRKRLIAEVLQRTGVELDENKAIVVMGRRMTAYKDQLGALAQIQRLVEELDVQVVVAGQAHPQDGPGQAMIEELHKWIAERPALQGKVVFVPGYLQGESDLEFDRILNHGGDFHISSPERYPRSGPRPAGEACGTSDERAVLGLTVPLFTPRTGGGQEYIRPSRDPRQSNGAFLDPALYAQSSDGPEGAGKVGEALVEALRPYTELFHEFQQEQNADWLRVLHNVYRTIPEVGIDRNVARQVKALWLPALRDKQLRKGDGVHLEQTEAEASLEQGLHVQGHVDIGDLDVEDVDVVLAMGTPDGEWTQIKVDPAHLTQEGRQLQVDTRLFSPNEGKVAFKLAVAPKNVFGENPPEGAMSKMIHWSYGDDRVVDFKVGGLSEATAKEAGLANFLRLHADTLQLDEPGIAAVAKQANGNLAQLQSVLSSMGRDIIHVDLDHAEDHQPVAALPNQGILVTQKDPFSARAGTYGYGSHDEHGANQRAVAARPQGQQVFATVLSMADGALVEGFGGAQFLQGDRHHDSRGYHNDMTAPIRVDVGGKHWVPHTVKHTGHAAPIKAHVN